MAEIFDNKTLKSLELAAQIDQMKVIIREMDMDYVKETAEAFTRQGNFQDSAAVLYPANPLEKNELLRTMGKALTKLHEFVELLKQCDEGKQKVKDAQDAMRSISKLFM